MTRYSVRISEDDFDRLQELTLRDMPREAGAFALAGSVTRGGDLDILVRRPLEVPREEFRVQHEYRLEVAPRAINGLAALCEANALGAVICHSHPSESPYSASDDHGERRLVEALRPFIPPGAPTASLLFWPGGVAGRVWLPGEGGPVDIAEVVVVGRRIRRFPRDDKSRLLGVSRITQFSPSVIS